MTSAYRRVARRFRDEASGISAVWRRRFDRLAGRDEERAVSFDDLLPLVEAHGPAVTQFLGRGQETRTFRLLTVVTQLPPFVPAMHQFLKHCRHLSDAFAESEWPALGKLAQRLCDDIEIGIEGMLCGRPSMVSDVGRDLMEVEFLIYDFAASPEQIAKWDNATEKSRARAFGFGATCSREEKRRGLQAGISLPDRLEYEVHCQQLHPTPTGGIHQGRGFAGSETDSWLWHDTSELLIHSHRTLWSFYMFIASRGDSWRDETLMDDQLDVYDEWYEEVGRQNELAMKTRYPDWERKPRDLNEFRDKVMNQQSARPKGEG